MRLRVFTGAILLGFAASGCIGQSDGSDPLGGPAQLLKTLPDSHSGAVPLDLEETERIAESANPEVAVATRRVAMARAHVSTAGALDDPMAMYRGWGVPLKRPWDYNAAQNMFGVSQAFSSRAKRDLRTSLAESDVDQAQANLEGVRLSVRVQVRKAFFDLLIAQEETRIHHQHVDIAEQAINASRIKYSVGNVPQQDVLKAQMALTQLAEHMIHFERDAEVARVRLNTLLGRSPDSPVEVRGEHAVLTTLPNEDSLEAAGLKSRPDLVAAKAAALRSHKEQQLAGKAFTPDFTLSAGYMVMPSGQDFRNSYMVEGSMNLPWLNRKKHDAEIAEAKLKTTEQDAELAALENSARGQIAEVLAEARSAQRLASYYHNQLKPQAEATLQSSVIAYENNKAGFLDLLDSQMRVVDVDLAWAQAVGEFDERLADLEMATGGPVNKLGLTNVEVK